MFPLHVKFSRDIKLVNIEKQNPQNILVFLEKRLSNKNADNIYVNLNSVTFKNSLFKFIGWSWALMLPVDSGRIKLETINNNRLSFEYEISLRRILLIAGVICMFIYSKSNSVTMGLISFAWL